ncbi:MAG: tetratricopeptide repeat protein [Gemmatimonadaceae bacterium]
MIGADGRAALAALTAARPTVARLDVSRRNSEETAADLIEIWSVIETALRMLLGGSALAGQPLIREVRQREALTLDQAHALLEFLAVRERVQRTEYQPTSEDVTVARDAYRNLEAGLSAAGSGATIPMAAAAGRDAAVGATAAGGIGTATDPMVADFRAETRRRNVLLGSVAAIVLLLGLAGVAYSRRASQPTGIQRGADLYAGGRREEARREFELVARDHPELALPHIYLGRIARETGDTSAARQELVTAVRLDTGNALAYRELAAFLLSRGQTDAARTFYVRALQHNPNDTIATGYLGCALVRLGRAQEGARFLDHAGPGPWRSCASAPPPAIPGPPYSQARPPA